MFSNQMQSIHSKLMITKTHLMIKIRLLIKVEIRGFQETKKILVLRVLISF